LAEIGLLNAPNRGSEMHSFFWWILDRELISAQRERVDGRGRRRMEYVFQMSPSHRHTVLASINRSIEIFRRNVTAGPFARGIPLDVFERAQPERAGPRAPEQIAHLETLIAASATTLIDQAIASGNFRASVTLPTPRYRTVQGALERGTYADNLLLVKYSMANGAELQIRGCRIGQNVGWLGSFRDFFGHGEGEQRSRPHVSAPKLRHVFGIRMLRRGRRWIAEISEWLQRGRRRIYPEDPRFEANIEHVR
jgi:hypothetical protein